MTKLSNCLISTFFFKYMFLWTCFLNSKYSSMMNKTRTFSYLCFAASFLLICIFFLFFTTSIFFNDFITQFFSKASPVQLRFMATKSNICPIWMEYLSDPVGFIPLLCFSFVLSSSPRRLCLHPAVLQFPAFRFTAWHINGELQLTVQCTV